MTTFTTATSTNMLTSHNPATQEIVGEVPITPESSIPDIIAKARAAQPDWAALSMPDRMEKILPLGETLQARKEELALLLTREMGKPLKDARFEIDRCSLPLADRLNDIAVALEPDVIDDGKTHSVLYHDPLGVCAAISPWNFPMAMPHSLVIPALMAGNTVVFKPSEETPLIGQCYGDILRESLPENVLQVVQGADGQGKTLVNGDVDLIAFTGSRETGKHILAAASKGLKRVILELGGKDPLIVLDDADIDAAADYAVNNSFRNAGQVCVSTERVYVDEAIAPQFEAAIIEKTQALKTGDGTEEGVIIGPMINAGQRDHVLQQLEQAKKDGASVLTGDTNHHDNFITPTVLTKMTHNMAMMREETFGPICCIMTFKNDNEAIQLANDTPFGLGATVFGTDLDRAAAVGRQLGSGMVGINRGCYGAAGCPWVGAHESGYGYHSGKDGHRQFTQTRVVSVPKS